MRPVSAPVLRARKSSAKRVDGGRQEKLQQLMPSTWKQARKASATWSPTNKQRRSPTRGRPRTSTGRKPATAKADREEDFEEQIEAAAQAAEHEEEISEHFHTVPYLRQGDLEARLDKFRFLDNYERDRDILLKNPRAHVEPARQRTIAKLDALLGVEPCSPVSSASNGRLSRFGSSAQQPQDMHERKVRFASNSSRESPSSQVQHRHSRLAQQMEKMEMMEAAEKRRGSWRYQGEARGFQFQSADAELTTEQRQTMMINRKEERNINSAIGRSRNSPPPGTLPDASAFLRRVESLAPDRWAPDANDVQAIEGAIDAGKNRIEEQLVSTLTPELRTYSAHIATQMGNLRVGTGTRHHRHGRSQTGGLASAIRKAQVLSLVHAGAQGRPAKNVRHLQARFTKKQAAILGELYKHEHETRFKEEEEEELASIARKEEEQREAQEAELLAKKERMAARRAALRKGAVDVGKKKVAKKLRASTARRVVARTTTRRGVATLTPVEAYLKHCHANGLVPKYKSAVQSYAEFLQETKHVKLVDISNRAMGSDQLAAFLHAFSKVDPPVEQWVLSANGLTGSNIGATLGALRIGCVTELDLSGNPQLGTPACEILAETILGQDACVLRELDLSNCNVRSAGAKHLATGLMDNTSLKRLNLRRNKVGAGGAAALAAAFTERATKHGTVLDDVNLSWNMVGSAAPALLSTTCILCLDLSMNALGGDSGALVEPIGEALRFNTTLLHLDLCNCGLTVHMIKAIGHALEDNHTLLGIHFDDHKLLDGLSHHPSDDNGSGDERSPLASPRDTSRPSSRGSTRSRSGSNGASSLGLPGGGKNEVPLETPRGKTRTTEEWKKFFQRSGTNRGEAGADTQPNDPGSSPPTSPGIGTGKDDFTMVSFTDSKGYVVSVPAHARLTLYDLVSGMPGEAPVLQCRELPDEAILSPNTSGQLCLRQPSKLTSMFNTDDQREVTAEPPSNSAGTDASGDAELGDLSSLKIIPTQARTWLNDPSMECRLDFRHRMCWTCGGFSEVKFVWENKFGLVVTHVYLHLQTDYFRPQAMHVDEGDAIDKNMCGANHNLYTLHRQVPPGRQHFFFTWDTDKTMLMIQHRDKPQDASLASSDSDLDDDDSAEAQTGPFEMVSNDYPTTLFPFKAYQDLLEQATGGDVDGDGILDIGSGAPSPRTHPAPTKMAEEDSDSEDFDEELKEMNYIDISLETFANNFGFLERLKANKYTDKMSQPRPCVDMVTQGPVWDIRRSIFAPRERESDGRDFFDNMEVYQKAFDVDWKAAGLLGFCQNTEEANEIRDVVWSCYPDIVRIFQHFTALKHSLKSNEVFCMRAGGFTEFVQAIGITVGAGLSHISAQATKQASASLRPSSPDGLENMAISKQELDLLFIVANADHEQAARRSSHHKRSSSRAKVPKPAKPPSPQKANAIKNNSFRSLTRGEFVGALVRLCQALNPLSYRRTPIKTLTAFLKDVVLVQCMKYNIVNDDFRRANLYLEIMDRTFHAHRKRLRKVFNYFRCSHIGADGYGTLSYQEWLDLGIEMLDDKLTEHDVKMAFMQSTMLVIDHETTIKHKTLSFVDFLEALARIASVRYASETFMPLEQQIEAFLIEYVYPRLPKNANGSGPGSIQIGNYQSNKAERRARNIMLNMKGSSGSSK